MLIPIFFKGSTPNKSFIKTIMYIWQLPQNILGLLVIFFSKARKVNDVYLTNYNFGVSLGKYIILDKDIYTTTVWKHEKGHQYQSQEFGFFYLLFVGIPSISRNIYDRIFHKKWPPEKRAKWYYSAWPENDADKRADVTRNYLTD